MRIWLTMPQRLFFLFSFHLRSKYLETNLFQSGVCLTSRPSRHCMIVLNLYKYVPPMISARPSPSRGYNKLQENRFSSCVAENLSPWMAKIARHKTMCMDNATYKMHCKTQKSIMISLQRLATAFQFQSQMKSERQDNEMI